MKKVILTIAGATLLGLASVNAQTDTLRNPSRQNQDRQKNKPANRYQPGSQNETEQRREGTQYDQNNKTPGQIEPGIRRPGDDMRRNNTDGMQQGTDKSDMNQPNQQNNDLNKKPGNTTNPDQDRRNRKSNNP